MSTTDVILDNAIWFSLTTRHSNIAEGQGRARRYPIGVSPLGAIQDTSDASFEALASLLRPDEEIALGSPTEISSVGALEAFARMTLRQMEDTDEIWSKHSCDTSSTEAMCLSCTSKRTIEQHFFTKRLDSRYGKQSILLV